MAERVALVTGVGRAEGIGFEVCRQLAQAGFSVVLTARNGERAGQLAAQLAEQGYAVQSLPLDVASPESIASAFAALSGKIDHLDVLVNNAAGLSPFGEQALTADLTVAHDVLETTLFGSWRMIETFLPLLRKSPSARIVNVSSGAGSHGDTAFGLTTNNAMGTSYAVAKAALNALTVKVANELKGSGILVNAVCPGFTATFAGGAAMGARPVADGAASVVWAALLPDNGPTGGLFRDGKPLPW